MIIFETSCTVECDNCGESTEMDLTEYGGSPTTWGLDDGTLTEHGWEQEGGEHF